MQDDLTAFSHLLFNIPTSMCQPKMFSARTHTGLEGTVNFIHMTTRPGCLGIFSIIVF